MVPRMQIGAAGNVQDVVTTWQTPKDAVLILVIFQIRFAVWFSQVGATQHPLLIGAKWLDMYVCTRPKLYVDRRILSVSCNDVGVQFRSREENLQSVAARL